MTYPFDYCWQKTNECKPGVSGRVRSKSDQSESTAEEEDEFEQMWNHSKSQIGQFDSVTNFGNEIILDNLDECNKLVEVKKPDIPQTSKESSIEKKS